MSKGKSGKKLLIIVVIAVVVVIALLFGISQAMGPKEVIPVVQTVQAEKGDIEQNLDATGNVESQNKKTFFSPVNATVNMVDMEVGDSVKAGTKLITFDLEDLEKENQKAEWNIRTGNLDIEDAVDSANTAASKQANAAAQVGPLEQAVEDKKAEIQSIQELIGDANSDALSEAQTNAANAVKAEKAALKKAYEAEVKAYNKENEKYKKKLEAAKGKYEDAIINYNTASSAYEIAFQTWSNDTTGTISEQTVTDASTKKGDAEVKMNEAEATYTALYNNPPAVPTEPDYNSVTAGTDLSVTADTSALESELEAASSELAELQAELSQQKSIADADVTGVSAASLEKMDISTNLAELEAKSIEELIEEGKKGIVAEFNGVISKSGVVEGSMVSQGMEMFTLESTEDVCVDITISKNDYEKVQEGQNVTITMGANTYHGTVAKVNRIATVNDKGAPVIGAKIQINDSDENIFLGVDAKVTIEVAKVKDVVMVPVEVVNIGNSGSFCYVVENGIIVKKLVETGISSNDSVEIISGLEVGAEVIPDIGTFAEGDKATAIPQVTAGAATDETATVETAAAEENGGTESATGETE